MISLKRLSLDADDLLETYVDRTIKTSVEYTVFYLTQGSYELLPV